MNDELSRLAELIQKRNALECEITELISRPAAIGHIGEYIASRIFGITLEDSASRKGIDGHFSGGSLKSCSVNIKWYAMREGILDITPDFMPDYYLALVGPRPAAMTSRDRTRPWLIESVFLFNAGALKEELSSRGVRVGTACSVKQSLWEQAEVFPNQKCLELVLSPQQRQQIALFGAR
jgi:hypothetical protein